MKTSESALVRTWFRKHYPNDEIYKYMNSAISFYDVFRALNNYENVYRYIFKDGVQDSIVRDIIFNELSKIMGVSIDYIFEQYEKCDNSLGVLTKEQQEEFLNLIDSIFKDEN